MPCLQLLLSGMCKFIYPAYILKYIRLYLAYFLYFECLYIKCYIALVIYFRVTFIAHVDYAGCDYYAENTFCLLQIR